ncbi:MAG: hypothetical protein D6828_01570 [Nitrospirae bacterium]|nr:MAG: hypothetical protein D6828_01570 [Nitrospirota bacterium]
MSKSTYEKIVERKKKLAEERTTRVVFARTSDMHLLLNLASWADKAISMLRNGAGIKYDPVEVFGLIQKYHDKLRELHEITEELCQKAGIEYKPSRFFSNGSGEKSKLDQ